MKYMGSKRSLLKNGLGELIKEQAAHAERVVDLFCGAASVTWFAAQNTGLPVLAADLQTYAVILAQAVIGRDSKLPPDDLASEWLDEVRQAQATSPLRHAAESIKDVKDEVEFVYKARTICSQTPTTGPIWNAYGGHYFSPMQALTFDLMLEQLPTKEPERGVCLAATLSAASRCAAAPGHTAQPFQPTPTAMPFIREAWARDPLLDAGKSLQDLCARHANVLGRACVSDAVNLAATLQPDDLVIVDPPYSGVQYSRFYHVLETMARGKLISVDGVGRYPDIEDRPQSTFSNKSQSQASLVQLLSSLARAGSTVIFTFPSGECSNGLSGDLVIETAQEWYAVKEKQVDGRFSTLGGNKNGSRASRKPSSELILLMLPAGTRQ